MTPRNRVRWRLAGGITSVFLSVFAGNLLAQAIPEITDLAGKVPGTVLLILATGTLATALLHGIAKVIQIVRPAVERREVNKVVSDTMAHQTDLIESYGRVQQEQSSLLARLHDLLQQQLRAVEKQGELLLAVSTITSNAARSVEEHRNAARDQAVQFGKDLERIEDAIRDLPVAVRAGIGQKLAEGR